MSTPRPGTFDYRDFTLIEATRWTLRGFSLIVRARRSVDSEFSCIEPVEMSKCPRFDALRQVR